MRVHPVLHRYGDLLLAAGLALGYTVELLNYPDSQPDVTIPLAVAASLALSLRRKAPLAVYVIVLVANMAIPHFAHDFDAHSIFFVAVFLINLYSLGAWARGVEAWLGVVAVVGTVVLAVSSDGDTSPSGVFFGMFLCGLPWAAGVALRLRREKDQELREREITAMEETAHAVTAERSRIARELHDVVSHAIAVTVLQARGGRKMVGRDDEAVRRALSAIEDTNTAALADMRRLLALLRDADEGQLDNEPQPSLERLDRLAAQVRDSGLPVELEVTGDPLPLPPGLDLSAYRIVQEALTNVLKHAGPGARACVHLGYRPDELEVSVTNTGSTGGVETPGGHGLIGIRERVSVAGGQVEAGPSEGGYAVRARLPYLLETS